MKFKFLGIFMAAAVCAALPQQLAADAGQMQQRLNHYFDGERSVGIFLLGTGALSLGAGGYLYAQGEGIYRGISYPFLVLGLTQLLIGGGVLYNNSSRVDSLSQKIASDAPGYFRDESDRMRRLNTTFNILKTVEIVFMVTGVVLALVSKSPTWQGVGVGLAIQGSLLFSVDVTAHKRAGIYAEDITQFSLSYKLN